jgi:hypothetical protein
MSEAYEAAMKLSNSILNGSNNEKELEFKKLMFESASSFDPLEKQIESKKKQIEFVENLNNSDYVPLLVKLKQQLQIMESKLNTK